MWLTRRFLYALYNFFKFSPQIEPFSTTLPLFKIFCLTKRSQLMLFSSRFLHNTTLMLLWFFCFCSFQRFLQIKEQKCPDYRMSRGKLSIIIHEALDLNSYNTLKSSEFKGNLTKRKFQSYVCRSDWDTFLYSFFNPDMRMLIFSKRLLPKMSTWGVQRGR